VPPDGKHIEDCALKSAVYFHSRYILCFENIINGNMMSSEIRLISSAKATEVVEKGAVLNGKHCATNKP
jgi:hypothetical protein